MNNTILLNNLYSIQKNPGKLDELISLIKAEIMDENNITKKGTKARTKAALAFLKANKYRESLKHTSIQTIDGTDYQCFTNSFVGFFLKESLPLPTVEMKDHVNMSYVYPYNLKPFELDINDVLNAVKLKNDVYHLYDDIGVSSKYVKIVTQVLGSNDLEVYTNGELGKRGLLVFKHGEDVAIVAPVRIH